MSCILFYDIQLEIFSHLTEAEYLPLRLVCKEWNNTIVSIDDGKEINDLIEQHKFLQALLVTKYKNIKSIIDPSNYSDRYPYYPILD